MKKRIKTIFNNIETPPDALIIKNATQPFLDPSFFYITGIEHGIFEGSYAFAYPDGTLDLIIPELEAETAKHTTAHLHIYKTKDDVQQLLKKFTAPLHSVGVNSQAITQRDYQALQELCPHLTFRDISSALIQTRLIKDTKELDLITHACHITDTVIHDIPSLITTGLRENELAAEIDYRMQKNGAEKPAFTTISSFGKNTAEPHYSHGETTLKNGDFILCDFGACYHNYNADVTRTFVHGKANTRQKDIYHTVLQAQTIGLDMIRPGISASDVHHAVFSFIETTPWKGRFIHSTGHALGLSVHDGPGFTEDSPLTLKENMVLTVEPGIYIPGYGGVRIEDDIVVTKNGYKLLTQSSKTLQELQ
ncbi:MAG: Xaa-Pro peptidase family protein [Methanobacteriota archaeon]